MFDSVFLGVPFYQALADWKEWIVSTRRQYKDCPIWFVAHNGNRYDLPLLFQQEAKLGQTPGTFLESVSCFLGVIFIEGLCRSVLWVWLIRSFFLDGCNGVSSV